MHDFLSLLQTADRSVSEIFTNFVRPNPESKVEISNLLFRETDFDNRTIEAKIRMYQFQSFLLLELIHFSGIDPPTGKDLHKVLRIIRIVLSLCVSVNENLVHFYFQEISDLFSEFIPRTIELIKIETGLISIEPSFDAKPQEFRKTHYKDPKNTNKLSEKLKNELDLSKRHSISMEKSIGLGRIVRVRIKKPKDLATMKQKPSFLK